MKKIICFGVIVLSFVFTPKTYSQGVISLTGAGRQHDVESWLERNKLRSFNENNESVGERYLFEEWKPGSVETTDGIKLSEVELKYDLLLDILIGKLPGGAVSLKKNNILHFSITEGGQTLNFKTLSVDDEKVFAQSIHEGKRLNLFKRHSVKLIKKDDGNQAYGSGIAYDKYVSREEFIVKKGNEAAISIKPSKRSVTKLLNDREEQIREFMKKNSLNVKNENELKKVFEYYESITN
ncbi:hypothetical protein SAMN05421640_2536 [Ekhidna lutea]|uniref:Uncharacterized protein n=1 Tax=Ekhidna lutea TaxID=447679 RepID=A0A239KC02_EKHLU|nr:hypothetical protein [Ekhidna lutea]SNT15222.1 hypothetical protein SAMN05421640_2536 [Ekhidna lutea]